METAARLLPEPVATQVRQPLGRHQEGHQASSQNKTSPSEEVWPQVAGKPIDVWLLGVPITALSLVGMCVANSTAVVGDLTQGGAGEPPGECMSDRATTYPLPSPFKLCHLLPRLYVIAPFVCVLIYAVFAPAGPPDAGGMLLDGKELADYNIQRVFDSDSTVSESDSADPDNGGHEPRETGASSSSSQPADGPMMQYLGPGYCA